MPGFFTRSLAPARSQLLLEYNSSHKQIFSVHTNNILLHDQQLIVLLQSFKILQFGRSHFDYAIVEAFWSSQTRTPLAQTLQKHQEKFARTAKHEEMNI
eukprot:2778494-Amphidinium_carterae.1